MPRISKTDTIFKVNDTIWLARFEHQHTSKDKKLYFTSKVGRNAGKPREVQHITTCKLSFFSKPRTYAIGVAPCSLQDTYNWRKGLIRAFKKSLERAGFCRFDWDSEKKREVVVALKDSYQAMIDNFVAALSVKDYAPHNIKEADKVKLVGLSRLKPLPIIEGDVVASELINETPAENRNGIGYTGAD